MEYDREKIPIPKTTYQAVKKKCLDCVGGERPEIKGCPITDCLLWPHRFGIGPATAKKKGHNVGDNSRNLTMKDLRAECVLCMGSGIESYKDIRECADINCGLFPFRLGHR